jgi:hypothetical protein
VSRAGGVKRGCSEDGGRGKGAVRVGVEIVSNRAQSDDNHWINGLRELKCSDAHRQNGASSGGTATMIYTYYDKIYTVPGIGHAPPGLPGPKAPPAWYQALPEQAQKACLLGALIAVAYTILMSCGCRHFNPFTLG